MSSFQNLIRFITYNPDKYRTIRDSKYFLLYIRTRYPGLNDKALERFKAVCGDIRTSSLLEYYNQPLKECAKQFNELQDKAQLLVFEEIRAFCYKQKNKFQGSAPRGVSFGKENDLKVPFKKDSKIYGVLHNGGIAPYDRYASYKENW